MTRSPAPHRPLRLAVAAVAALLAAAPALRAQCTLEYRRADNAFAAAGRPDGNLGVEQITLAEGQRKVFVTDWRFEKQRNDGTNHYGSHLRQARSTGAQPVTILLRGGTAAGLVLELITGDLRRATLAPGQSAVMLKHDLVEVICGSPKG